MNEQLEDFGEFLLGLVAGAILVAMLVMAAPEKACADTYAVATLASHHFEHPDNHNEKNLGLGFETDVAHDLRAIGGFYKNSDYRETVYGGVAYLPFQIGDLKLGAGAALGTGYGHLVDLGAFGVAAYERDGWGVNLGLAPPTSKTPAVLGLQFKLKFQ